MYQLASLDAAFVYLESSKMSLHMSGMTIYDPSTAPGGQVSFREIVDNIASRTADAPVLQRRLARVPLDLDHPYWVQDEPVDLDYHINHLALPKPADWREFCAQMAKFFERPLDMNRPLWEMLVIEGLDAIGDVPPNAFALLTKIHHSTMDGAAGMDFMGAIHDHEPAPPARPTPEPHVFESPSTVDMLVRAVPGVVRNPWRILNVVAGIGPSLVPAVARRALSNFSHDDDEPSAPSTPVTRFNAAVGARRNVGAIRVSLADVKTIKNAVPDATVNDAVMALIGGALRHYLDDVGELPNESLVGAMAISLRGAGPTEGAANQLTLTTIALGSDIADPLERVAAIHRTSSLKKAVKEGEGAKRLVEIADALPSGLMGMAGRLMSQVDLASGMALFNLGVTNVPGPSTPLYMTGAKATEIYGFAASTNGLGFVNVVSSYCGAVTIGFQGGSQMVPDPERYEDCLRKSFNELVDAARGVGSPTALHRTAARRAKVGRR